MIIKDKSGKKRYGQNNTNKKGYLNKREILLKEQKIITKTNKYQKQLNKFKPDLKNKNIININGKNNKFRNSLNNIEFDESIISKDCKIVFQILDKWNVNYSWATIDISNQEYYNETTFKTFPCCYNNNNIVCEDNKIVELYVLNFVENMIEGEIPEEIGELKDLTRLFLSTNNLTGNIPNTIGNLENLEYLWLYYNNLNGTIPSSIGALSNLKSLNLHGNELSGNIPSELGNLKNLEILDLHNNKLEGDIPDSFENLTKLNMLYLNENKFNITNVSCMPENVQYCNFKSNQISQPIFNSLKIKLPCSSATPNISFISLPTLILVFLINILFLFKSSLF
eukprot:jgi/Orpsp1_1/1177325/evm.model.c7180000060998.1